MDRSSKNEEIKMNTQYYHGTIDKQHYKEFTMALEVPSKIALLDFVGLSMNGHTKMTLMLGISVVHPKDTYVKRIGREISTSKMEGVEFYLHKITQLTLDTIAVDLYDGGMVSIRLEIKHDRERVYLTAADANRFIRD